MKIAMAREGKGFHGDGIDLSWPLGGTRQVIEMPDDLMEWPARVRDRYSSGAIVAVDLPVNFVPKPPEKPVILIGGSPEQLAYRARAVQPEPEPEPEPQPEPTRLVAEDEPWVVEPEPEPEPEPAPPPRRSSRRRSRS